jgi:hypothetical protein
MPNLLPSSPDALAHEEAELWRMEQQLVERRELVKRAREQMGALTPTHKLACVLHDRLCHWNHTDGCAWHYAIKDGVHDWGEHSHQVYHHKAVMVMQRLSKGVITQENVTDFLSDVLK